MAENEIVDARGLYCPVPVLRLKRKLRGLPAGRRVVLVATDPAAPLDVLAFCNIEGHVYLGETPREGGVFEIAVAVGRVL
ncbi:MAG TPA: sulfurtransferase TusA family protein [Candidatus Polarisedimenticolaceae bacterium]|nr:sulfurtransferase TusA family protein [Candidatus Polarisedimenticolaceae bacterium]